MKNISIIACAQLPDYGVGFENKLLYPLKEDMEHFKTLTSGHPVIMGRSTWESIPAKFRPLPLRTNIVLTRSQTSSIEAGGGVPAPSIEEALQKARASEGSDEIFIIGGSKVWEDAFPLVNTVYLTEVEGAKPADTFFPSSYLSQFNAISKESFVDEKTGTPFKIVIFERKS